MAVKEKEGSVIVVSLVIVTVTLLLLSIFMGSIIYERKNLERSHRNLQALYLAEAGVEEAIWKLYNTPASADSGQIVISGSGRCDYTITVSGQTVTIQATGYSPEVAVAGQAVRSVEVTLTGGVGSTVFDMALFGGADEGRVITITGNTRVDSYNSEGQGKLYPNGLGNNGDIGTNSTSTSPTAIRITGNSDVYGTVYIGQGGDPDQAIQVVGNAEVHEDKLALDEYRELPEVELPSFPLLPDRGALKKSGNNDYYVHESGRYSSIKSSGNGDLIFDDNANYIYVDGDFQATGNGDIIVDTDMVLYIGGDFKFTGNGQLKLLNGHTLIMYVAGRITGTGNGLWNDSEDPTKLVVYALDTSNLVKITGNADFYGAIYARNAEIKVAGNGDVYGSLVGNTIKITGNSDVHYDEALADSNNLPSAPTYPGGYTIELWAER